MKILITGANGFIGRHVVEHLLLNKENEIVSLISINKKPHPLLAGSTILVADLFALSAEEWRNHLSDVDVVLHLAWTRGFNHQSPEHINNVMQHLFFIQQVINSGVKRLCIAGTMHEIGYHVGPVSANTPCNPLNPYGIAKNFLRQVAFDLAKKNAIDLQWLRFFYITGDDIFNNSIFSKLLDAAKCQKMTFPLNSGDMLYDFIDIKNLARQISTAVLTQRSGVFNCASGKPMSLRSRVEKFIADNELTITPEYNVFPIREYDSMAIWAEISEIIK